MVIEVKSGNKGFVAADDDHDQQVGDHDDVNQAEYGEHDVGFSNMCSVKCVVDQMAQFDHEQPAIDDLGNDQAQVERGLNPAAGKD
jgi:hypothetical protein